VEKYIVHGEILEMSGFLPRKDVCDMFEECNVYGSET